MYATKKTRQTIGPGAYLANRRGGFADYCRLPATTGPVALSTTSPYQLLTLDASDPTLALLIALKPLKVMRIALDFIPMFIIATQVGYVMASKSGQMLRLDHHGEILDQCKLLDPSEQQLTAIAALDNDELLIADLVRAGESAIYLCSTTTHGRCLKQTPDPLLTV